jgi:hypothetical protein
MTVPDELELTFQVKQTALFFLQNSFLAQILIKDQVLTFSLLINNLKFSAMKTQFENRFRMELALRDFLNQNAAITATLPGFGNYFGLFSGNMDQIQVIREIRAADRTGNTRKKVLLRQDLIAKALDISRKAGAYARLVQNVVLAQEVFFRESTLIRSTDSLLKDRATLILNKAKERLDELTSYGITEEALKALQTAIDLFSASIPKTRLDITERKQSAIRLARLFELNDALLEKLDDLMEIVRISQSDFFNAYQSNRKVVETSTATLALKATVSDALTKERIKGVKVSFVFQNGNLTPSSGKAEIAQVKITSEKGMFLIKSLAAGEYKAILSKPGYKEQVVPVSVAEHEMTEFYAELERK